MHSIIAYPEKAQRDLLYVIFRSTDALEHLTGLPSFRMTLEKDPAHGIFAFSFKAADEKPVYIYFRSSTFGSPKTEYEQIREQASFIHRNPDAHYFALLLREAWFEWADDYIQRRIELPMHRLGYESLLSALDKADLSQIPSDLRQEVLLYRRHLQKEYDSFFQPVRIIETRLRQYAILWNIRRIAKDLWHTHNRSPLELDIRTQPHVHSAHLDQVFLRQHPPHRIFLEGYEITLRWELEKDGLFLRVWLPPMREKAARSIHTHLRKQAQACLEERFNIGRTRGTLKGIDAYHAREANLLRIELPEMQELMSVHEGETFGAISEKVATDLVDAIRFLPEIEARVLSGLSPALRTA
ncbi:MAG: hypothetical protein RML92_07395 [Bacteroidia bacterium]|nr:hypothetical protein [Bacteroidia bacterium]